LKLTPDEIKLKIKELGKEQASELLTSIYLSSNNFEIRRKAIELLAEIGGDRNFKLIENALISDENPYVRILAAQIIGKYYKQNAINPLMWALNDKSATLFKVACEQLIKIAPYAILNILINYLNHDSPTFRHLATNSLVKLGKIAINPLIDSLTSKDFNTRMHALKALQKMNDKNLLKYRIKEVVDSKTGLEKLTLLSLLQKIEKF